MILDFNRHSSVRAASAQPDFRMAHRELEGILQQVAYSRRQHLRVGLNLDVVRPRRHSESASSRPSVERGCGLDFSQKPSQTNVLQARRKAGSDSYLRQGSIDEV